MKIPALILFAIAALTSVRAETLDLTSSIRAVTVYADRARVTRSGQVELPAGEQVVRFSGLPVGLDDSSVQAAGTGNAAFKILGLEIRDKFSPETLNARVRELESQLQALDDQKAELAAQANDVKDRRVFLQKVRDGLVLAGPPDGKMAPQGLEKVRPLYEFYTAELDKLSKQNLALAAATRDLQPKRQVLEEELNRLRGSGARAEKEVLVAVKAGEATTASLSVSYNMQGASWQPLYDARVGTKDGKVDLASYGVVRQQTGEDWRDVRLSLSTARPSVGARMPELEPQWLQILEVRPLARGMATENAPPPAIQAMAMNSFSDATFQGRAEKTVAADMETATIESSGVSAVFEIKLPSSIPSDGEAHKVPIATQKFDGALEYVSTPSLGEMAYLKARLTNTSEAPLLGGEVNLFRDGDFVGKSHVNFIASGAQFDFFLGVDDGVKITRKTLLDKASEGGLLSRRKGVARKYETTIESFKPQAIKLTVLDQLPVSQDASINVSGVKFSDSPKTQEKDTGKLTWEFSIEPKQKKVLTEEYTVEWPADKQIGGL